MTKKNMQFSLASLAVSHPLPGKIHLVLHQVAIPYAHISVQWLHLFIKEASMIFLPLFLCALYSTCYPCIKSCSDIVKITFRRKNNGSCPSVLSPWMELIPTQKPCLLSVTSVTSGKNIRGHPNSTLYTDKISYVVWTRKTKQNKKSWILCSLLFENNLYSSKALGER